MDKLLLLMLKAFKVLAIMAELTVGAIGISVMATIAEAGHQLLKQLLRLCNSNNSRGECSGIGPCSSRL